MDLWMRFETYIAMKSVPPVDPFAFRARVMASPLRNPPNATLRMISSRIGSNCTALNKKEVRQNCSVLLNRWSQDFRLH